MNKYDVFISYRRSSGEYTAKIIKDRLEESGYKVFFDVESLRSGDFNTKLYSVIEQCSDFLLILSPDSLDRTEAEDDWMRLEIEHALKNNINIVPVLLRGFEFPSKLPQPIDSIRYKNGIEANTEFFDAFIKRLSNSFLKSKPTIKHRITQNVVFRKTLPFFISLVVLAGLVAGGFAIFGSSVKTYPTSRFEMNLTDEVLLYMQNNLFQANMIIGEMNAAYDASEDYIDLVDSLSYQKAVSAIDTAYSNIEKLAISEYSMKDELSKSLGDSAFKKADLQVLNSNISLMQTSMLDALVNQKTLLDPAMNIDHSTFKEWLHLQKDYVDCFSLEMVYATNILLLPVGDTYLVDFKQKMLPAYTNLPYGSIIWQTDENELNRLLEINLSKAENSVNKMAELVGNKNLSAVKEQNELIDYSMSLGLSREEAEKYAADIIEKSDDITEMKNQIDKTLLEIESQRKEAQEKFAPLPTDEPGILWGKMLRFNSLALYDDAIKCAQAFQQKVRGNDEFADTYIPIVIKFFEQIKETGIDYGVIVVGYGQDGLPHEFYKIGDIIVAMNGVPCRTVEDISDNRKESGNVVTLLRLDDQGDLKLGDYNLPSGKSELLLNNLSEKGNGYFL